MILPTKHIPTDQSLLGSGASVLRLLSKERTITDLWERARKTDAVGSYQRFLLSLDFLYAIGVVELRGGFLRRVTSAPQAEHERRS